MGQTPHLQLPDLPQASGGQMAGVSNGTLLVVGGSYFQGSLFEGGRKLWLDTVLALEPRGSNWKPAGKLDHPLAYGGAVSLGDSVIVIGGSDGKRHYPEVRRLRWRDGHLEQTLLPPLPQPLANLGAAVIGHTIFVAGGQVVAAQGEELFVVSGAELLPDADGKTTRRYLTDGWRYLPDSRAGMKAGMKAGMRADSKADTGTGKGWKRIADVPVPVVAAPATGDGSTGLLVFGGDDGANARRVFELKDLHPGFGREILTYDPTGDRWSKTGELPVSLVTTAAVKWRGAIVIPGGEDRPGHRSARVLKVNR